MDYEEARVRMFGCDDSLKEIIKNDPYVNLALKVYQEEHYHCISKQKVREAIEKYPVNNRSQRNVLNKLLKELGL